MKFKNIILFGAAALISASCSDDDDKKSGTAGGPISFVSEYQAYNSTGDQWKAGDAVGFYMMETRKKTPLANADNVRYSTTTGGESATFTAEAPLSYPVDGMQVDFVGYYPYSAAITDYSYPINIADQTSGLAAHDLMTARSLEGHSQESGQEVSVTFKHRLSKTAFQFVTEEGAPVQPERVIIKGVYTSATLNLLTDVLQEAKEKGVILPLVNGGMYHALVLPGEVLSTYIVEYEVDGRVLNYYIADTEPAVRSFQSGQTYTFTLTVPKEDEATKGIVEIGEDNSLAPWENGGINDDSAEYQISYETYPLNAATAVYKDTYLTLTFKGQAPTIGTTGTISIYKADDRTLVDQINMADEQVKLEKNNPLNSKHDILGVGSSNNGNRYRVVNYNPITINGQTAIIKPHYNKLAYDTKYYVVVDAKAIKHPDFFGINESSKWTFTTKAAPSVPADNTVSVGDEKSGADFRTVQAALDFLATNVAKDAQKTVNIRNGVYEEMLFLRGVNNVLIKGESRDKTIIRYDNYDGFNPGSGGSVAISPTAAAGTKIEGVGGRAMFLVEGVDKLRIENLTMENTHVKAGNGDQAEVLYANNDNKAIAFVNCTVLSCQDTFNLKGFCWFYNSLIAGDVDFIWGSPAAALFEACELRSVNDGYLLQARVAKDNKGFVFLNCDLTTTGLATKMYLSRTANNGSFDNITFANCKMADIYVECGWGLAGGGTGANPNPVTATLENGYKTYNCTDLKGNPVTINNSQFAYTLTEAEYLAGFSSREKVLSAYTGGVSWFAQ